MDGSVLLAGTPVQVGGDVMETGDDGEVRISPGAPGGEPSMSPFAFAVPLGELPCGQRLSAVRQNRRAWMSRRSGPTCPAPLTTLRRA